MANLNHILGGLLNPFPAPDLWPAQNFSDLDFASERLSLEATENFFATCPRAAWFAGELTRFLDDAEGLRVIKKYFHVVYELRMRNIANQADPPSDYGFGAFAIQTPAHPIETACRNDLVAAFPDRTFPQTEVSTVGRLRHLVSVYAWGAALLAKSAWIGLSRGRAVVEPRRARLVAPPFWPQARWRQIVGALLNAGASEQNLLMFTREREPDPSHTAGDHAVLHDRDMFVPRGEWWRRVMWPTLKLAVRVFAVTPSCWSEPRNIEAARISLHLAFMSLDIWRVAFNVRFDYCLDIYEYGPQHLLKGIVFRKFGGAVARLPHSQMDTPGCALSYLSYDLFLTSGAYQGAADPATWMPGMRQVCTGQMLMDHRFSHHQAAENAVTCEIERIAGQGRRIAAFFGPSSGFGLLEVAAQLLHVLWSELCRTDGWTLVIKPKGTNAFFDILASKPQFREILDDPRVVCVRYGEPGKEVCPSGWLLSKATMGVSLPGSVQVEGLTLGRPVFSYYPVNRDTPLWNRLRDAGLLGADLETMRRIFRTYFYDPSDAAVSYDWFRENFEPYGDGRALDRIAAALLDIQPAEDFTDRTSCT